jgi:hypothetical protein
LFRKRLAHFDRVQIWVRRNVGRSRQMAEAADWGGPSVTRRQRPRGPASGVAVATPFEVRDAMPEFPDCPRS